MVSGSYLRYCCWTWRNREGKLTLSEKVRYLFLEYFANGFNIAIVPEECEDVVGEYIGVGIGSGRANNGQCLTKYWQSEGVLTYLLVA